MSSSLVDRMRRTIGVLGLGAVACTARDYTPRNLQSDLLIFSNVGQAWDESKGADASVAVIDWQFDPAGPLAARFVHSTSVVPGEEIGKLKVGHGAWMAEIVSLVAPEARIILINARSLKQRDYQAFLIAGIRYAADHGAAAVTSSMSPVVQSQPLREAIDYAEDRGTIFVDVHPELIVRGDSTQVPCVAGACDAQIVHTGVVSVPEHPTSPDASRELYTWPYALAVRYRDGWGYSTAPPDRRRRHCPAAQREPRPASLGGPAGVA